MASPAAPPCIVIEHRLAGREAALVASFLPVGEWAIVADPDTWRVLGTRIAASLGGAKAIIFETSPKPTMERVARIASEAANSTGLIAVGSGTINDLAKMAAARLGVPYLVFPTAPSMNGYGSANASIVEMGWRVSRAAAAPVAILCDMEAIAAAPARLIAAGLGDSVCRAAIQTDWLLAHHLLDVPYDPALLTPVIAAESAVMADLPALARRDIRAVEGLMRWLLASGESMRQTGSSLPASQGEHMLAHTLAMLGRDIGLHGEQIAVTTMTMLTRQADLLAREAPRLAAEASESEMHAAFGAALAEELIAAARPKRRLLSDLVATGKLPQRWQAARRAIALVETSPRQIEQALRALGAPVTPQEIGWTEDEYETAIRLAPNTRERLTFLDLA